jgi:hypothetical protein
VAVHLDVDAVAAGIGKHLEEPGDPAFFARAAFVIMVRNGAADFLARFDDALEEVFAARVDADKALQRDRL